MTSYKTTRYDLVAAKSKFSRRLHAYDGTGRIANSTLRTWETGQSEPAGDSLEHTYAGGKPLQNFDGTSTYGAVWVFAGAQNSWGPLKSPAPDTASQKDYNTGSKWQPNRRTYQVATAAAEGDKRLLYGQGRPMTKDANGTGSTWSVGTKSQPTTVFGLVTVESRFEYQGTVAPTDMSRATDVREKDRTGIFGNTLSYAGSYSRVTSEALGRDINPLGRGDGMAYVGGWMNLGPIAPRLPLNVAKSGRGGSVNNSCRGCSVGGGKANGTLNPELNPGWDDQFNPPWLLPPNGPLPLPPPSTDVKPPNNDVTLPPIVVKPPNEEPSGGGNTLDQGCYDAWKRAREAEGWEGCEPKPCMPCSCSVNPCSPEEWQDPVANNCVDRFCTCDAEGCNCSGCCGTDCGSSNNGTPCCPNHCIICGGSGGNCPAPQTLISDIKRRWNNCMIDVNLAFAALIVALLWCLMGGPAFLPVCILILLVGMIQIARMAQACCNASYNDFVTRGGLAHQDACNCVTWCKPVGC